MNIPEMTTQELIDRRAAIATECEQEGADLEALTEEVRAINAELETRKAAETARQELRNAVAAGAGQTTKKMEKKENHTMDMKELRNSQAYIDAFAKYIRTGDDKECRALLQGIETREGEGGGKFAVLSQNVETGTVPVPEFIEGRIRTAWEKNGLMALVRKTYLPGNAKVGFEREATDAEVHIEGTDAINPERLILGVVTLTARSIKKMVRVSDEALDYGSREFLEYIYDEITYRISKAAEDGLLAIINNAGPVGTATMPGVAEIVDEGADLLGIVAKAYSRLSDEAANPVIVMNKATYAAFIAARNAAGYGVDPFMGFSVYFNNTLPTIDAAASDEAPWLIVGDFGIGAQANFPNGEDVKLKTDETTEMDADIVRILGRMFVGLGIVASNAFCKVMGSNPLP